MVQEYYCDTQMHAVVLHTAPEVLSSRTQCLTYIISDLKCCLFFLSLTDRIHHLLLCFILSKFEIPSLLRTAFFSLFINGADSLKANDVNVSINNINTLFFAI